MIYVVRIVEQRVVETAEGDSAMPAYPLLRRFSTIPLAEEAARAEIERLKRRGTRAFYEIRDLTGRLVGPNGPIEA